MELRSPDAGANPYLAYGLLILAGLRGIRENLALPAPEDIDFRTAKKRTFPHLPSLPDTLDDARLAAAESSFVRDSLPDFIFSAYTKPQD